MKTTRKMFIVACMLNFTMLLTTACSVLKPIEGAPSDKGSSRTQRGPSPVYHDFDDILIPGELKLNRRASSVFQTENVSMGVLSFNGKMLTASLIKFFNDNMAKDNWRSAGSFKAPRSLLLFEKGNRWCVITLADETYGLGSRIEIWVAPKTGGMESGLLK